MQTRIHEIGRIKRLELARLGKRLLDALVSGRANPQDPVGAHMSAPLPMVGSGEEVSKAVEALEKAGAAVVLVDGRPAGMITPQDVLAFLAGGAS